MAKTDADAVLDRYMHNARKIFRKWKKIILEMLGGYLRFMAKENV